MYILPHAPNAWQHVLASPPHFWVERIAKMFLFSFFRGRLPPVLPAPPRQLWPALGRLVPHAAGPLGHAGARLLHGLRWGKTSSSCASASSPAAAGDQPHRPLRCWPPRPRRRACAPWAATGAPPANTIGTFEMGERGGRADEARTIRPRRPARGHDHARRVGLAPPRTSGNEGGEATQYGHGCPSQGAGRPRRRVRRTTATPYRPGRAPSLRALPAGGIFWNQEEREAR